MWSSGTIQPFSSLLGGSGIGRSIAVAMSGASFDETFLASFDVYWDTGGFH
jgi:hypothetical protein